LDGDLRDGEGGIFKARFGSAANGLMGTQCSQFVEVEKDQVQGKDGWRRFLKKNACKAGSKKTPRDV